VSFSPPPAYRLLIMTDALWGFIGVIVGAVLAGAIELLRDRTAKKQRDTERARDLRAEACAQLLVAARRLRYAARADATIDPGRIDEDKTDLSTARYMIALLGPESVAQAANTVRRSVLDYVNAREKRGPHGTCETERLAARAAVKEFIQITRPEFA
jgi:hypothetical protein